MIDNDCLCVWSGEPGASWRRHARLALKAKLHRTPAPRSRGTDRLEALKPHTLITCLATGRDDTGPSLVTVPCHRW